MQIFIHDNFMLTNGTAEKLYHTYAEHLPIIDFHNHLLPKDIASDRIFGNISSLWLEGDHYKWRAMRACGINEKYITGEAGHWEKFEKWAATVPKTLRNPLYHWTHLELKRYFGIDAILDPSSAREIFAICNEKAKTQDYSVRNLLRMMNIEYLCSMEDPTDTLKWHHQIKDNFEINVSAAFRPDNVLNILDNQFFIRYILQLSVLCGSEITNYQQLCAAIEQRHDFFHDFGTRQADVALDWFTFSPVNDSEADRVLRKALMGTQVSLSEANTYRATMLSFLCELNHSRHWVQQFHLGALRNINKKGTAELGGASGFDAMNDVTYIAEFGKFLDGMELRGKLAKSIFFNLNPRDNATILTLINSFNDGLIPGKMQYGPAWWFQDHKMGIEQHLNDLAAYGVMGNFIGMLTDSRSFLSFPRHEYFRRILCNMLGKEVEEGLIPNDDELLKNTIENLCYYNARAYLNLHTS